MLPLILNKIKQSDRHTSERFGELLSSGSRLCLPPAAEGLRDPGGCSGGKERLQPPGNAAQHMDLVIPDFPSPFDGSEAAQKGWDNLSRAQGGDFLEAAPVSCCLLAQVRQGGCWCHHPAVLCPLLWVPGMPFSGLPGNRGQTKLKG